MRRLDARQPPPMCPAAICRSTTLPLSFNRLEGRRRRVRSGKCWPGARRHAPIAGPRGLVMSAAWDDGALLEPISAEQPCGQNLDEVPVLPGAQTAVLSELDGLRLFGQARSPEAPPDPEESERESASGDRACPNSLRPRSEEHTSELQ